MADQAKGYIPIHDFFLSEARPIFRRVTLNLAIVLCYDDGGIQPWALCNLFRSIAQGETKHAFGHFDHIRSHGEGDPATGYPVKTSREMLQSAIAGETYEYTEMYPGFAKTARKEGFDEIGEWMEVMAKAERVHAQSSPLALRS